MAKLLNLVSKESVLLRSIHVFGRSSNATNTIVNHANVSRVHASIAWQEHEWILQDKSTNGTFINNARVQKNENISLQIGDVIQFGSLQSEQWQVVSNEAPVSMLIPSDSSLPEIELVEVLALPNEDAPELTVYQDEQLNWVCETQQDTHILDDGDVLNIADKSWTFVSNVADEETRFNPNEGTEAQMSLSFKVSQNEEHVSLTVNYGEHEFDLGNKVQHYLLLLLARHWLAEKAQGAPEIDCGWLDKKVLCKEMRTQEQYMNIQIYRHRKQLAAMLPNGLVLPPTIERRYREVRLNCHAIEIQGGNPFA